MPLSYSGYNYSRKFFAISTLLLTAGLLIFFFASGFTRNYIGDVVVVMFLYSLLSSFFSIKPILKALVVLLIAVTTELAQLLLLTGESNIESLLLGAYFDPLDILAYISGLLIIFLFDKTIH